MKYYIPYDEKANINYIYLLYLYGIAEYNNKTKCCDTIKYSKLDQLADTINKKYMKEDCKSKYNSISSSTLSKLLNNTDYNQYFTYDRIQKIITLNNNIRQCKSFVVLNDDEVDIMMKYKDVLFCKYLLYIKYHCGASKSKKIDTTAKQFIEACKYSANSGSQLTKISCYNQILCSYGIIKIEKYQDNNGYFRNVYSIV